MQEKKHSNGFLLGLVIGGAVGALVSTKRGRQILKDVADYGLDYVGKAISMDDIESILEEDEDTSFYPKTSIRSNVDKTEHRPVQVKKESDEPDIPKMSMEKKEESTRRRIFRGIRKK